MMDTIVVLDFGSQVTQLIARCLREAGVFSEILPFNAEIARIREQRPKGIVLSGGPASAIAEDSPRANPEIFQLGLPLLGICYGQQLMVHQLGGQVRRADRQEFGKAFVEVTDKNALTAGIWCPGERHQVWMSHGDRVVSLPPGFHAQGRSDGAPFAIIADETRHLYGVQFHPEVIHTPDGAKLIARFAKEICGCAGNWTMAAFRQSAIARIRSQVGAKRVICGLSGGVDSSVAAVLIHEAIGDQLTCILVDHGLMRLNEADEVVSLFRGHYNIPLVRRDASDLFLERLAGVSESEEKRRIIGRSFVEVFEEEAGKIGSADFLAQGTLYPDVIESLSPRGGPSVTIKTHHNVGGLPERMNMALVEPLRELFKDEVRTLGHELGLPETLIDRHPFPGPGLAIRIPGAVTAEQCDILRKADALYIKALRSAGLYDAIWQAFAVLLPVRTVGVMGDRRTHDYVLALRAVTSSDGMTAESYPFDHHFIAEVATRIVNEVRGVNRVVYDITSKPPGTIEWE